MSALNVSHYISIPPVREWGFGRMLLAAMVAHVAILAVIHTWPREAVEHVPVRVLSFQLGEGMFLAPEVEAVVEEAPQAAPAPKPAAKKTVKKTKPITRNVPDENDRRNPEENFMKRIWSAPFKRAVPSEQPIAPEAQARKSLLQQSPKQYVREYGLPSLDQVLDAPETAPTAPIENSISELTAWQDAPSMAGEAAAQQGTPENAVLSPELIRQRYEQRISAWIAEHKLYPPGAAGKEGRVVVRIRIDRLGYVRFYAVETSSGIKALDDAAIDMVRRANPLPRPPAEYPAGELIEFLIPIGFAPPL